MELQNNPFYLLNVSCRDDRRKIVAAAEEMSFELEAEVSSEAQNSLLNMEKRLSCELNWFPAEDNAFISEIRKKINKKEAIEIRSSDSLTLLNAVRYNYSLLNPTDVEALFETLLSINGLFAVLDDEQITAELNKCRRAAKMPEMSAENVSDGINSLRSEIRQEITAGFAGMDDTIYRDLIVKLAEKMSGPENIIISDAIDEYEIRFQNLLEEKTEQIKEHISEIEKPKRKINRYRESLALIEEVQDWDQWAQPLQIKAQMNGMPHRMSESMGSQLRNLGVTLHNENGEAVTTYVMTSRLKDIFAESPNLSQAFQQDLAMLQIEIHSGKVDYKKDSFFEELQDSTFAFNFKPDSSKMDAYCQKLREQRNALLQFKETLGDTYTDLDNALFNQARSVALRTYNQLNQADMAKSIIKQLQQEYKGNADCTERLQKDLERLQKIEADRSKPQPGFLKRLFVSQNN